MIDLLLIFFGEQVVRRRWRVLMILGLVWIGIGAFFFTNAMLEHVRIAPAFFAIPLLIDALVTLVAAFSGPVDRRPLRLAKFGLFVAISLLIFFKPGGSAATIGILVGTVLVLDASWRAVSAYIVRFPKWRRSIGIAAFEFALGIWSFVPWPTHWEGEVGLDVGTLILVTGASLVGISLHLRRLPPGTPISKLLSDGWPADESTPESASRSRVAERGNLRVHVWTPTGGLAPLIRTVARYIAATDEQGLVSTGHSALEVPPDLYISHYPEVEPDRSSVDFARALRATQENDMPGRWQPSYAIESGNWCPSSFQIEFEDLNLGELRRFWDSYREDPTYNLTNRNCSSVVAKALDIAIEGAFARQARSPQLVLRLILLPELWTAGMMRLRATTMAWTPGILLDYARSLSVILSLRDSTLRTPHGKP